MKIHNLTDVQTDNLVRRGLYRQTIVVGNQAIQPGQSAELSEEHRRLVQKQIEHLVLYGAIAVDELPAPYRVAKMKLAETPNAASVPPPAAVPTPPPPTTKA